jgi:hypothetical protein
LAASFTVDFAGTIRPVGPSWDIGAYEAGNTSPVEPTPAYVGIWSFDGVATDSSGNSNHGTVTGATYSTGQYGQSLVFDGIDDVVTVADSSSLDLTHGLTLAGWFRPSSAMTTFKAGIVKNYKWYLYVSSEGYCGAGAILAGYEGGGTAASTCLTAPLLPNVWTHLAMTYDRSSIKIYRNGILATSTAASAFLDTSSGTLQIGASEIGEFFAGAIDEVYVRNSALSAAAVASLAQEPATEPDPAAPTSLKIGAAAAPLQLAAAAASLKVGGPSGVPSNRIMQEDDSSAIKTEDDGYILQE